MDAFAADVRRFVREQPGAWLSLVARRTGAFFTFTPNAGLAYGGTQVRLYAAAYVVLLLVGL